MRHDGPAGARPAPHRRGPLDRDRPAYPGDPGARAPCLITVNWAVYIWGVNNGHVVETSLGYFINPLVTVLMGVFILGERLRRWQWVALAVAALAVVVLTLDYGRPPWIALTLAFTFGSYGLCKKQANAPADREPHLRDAW